MPSFSQPPGLGTSRISVGRQFPRRGPASWLGDLDGLLNSSTGCWCLVVGAGFVVRLGAGGTAEIMILFVYWVS